MISLIVSVKFILSIDLNIEAFPYIDITHQWVIIEIELSSMRR